MLDALRADPKSVDLRQQAPHFYALAAKVLDLFEDDEVVDVLVEVCFTLLIVLVMSLSCVGWGRQCAEMHDYQIHGV